MIKGKTFARYGLVIYPVFPVTECVSLLWSDSVTHHIVPLEKLFGFGSDWAEL